MNLERIESKIDKVAAGSTEVSIAVGGLKFQNMVEVMEAAKLLSLSGPAVPKWLQGNPGGCWSIIMQAVEWGFSPISVAKMSYEVNGVVGYMSQLVHAVIETRAPLKGRLRCAFEGEGNTRVCVVTGQPKDEVDPLIYKSPPIANITPKNSPLWKTDPDQQLWFYSSRAWCRRYYPDCILGIYSKDELEDSHIGADKAKDITPKPSIADRLKGSENKRGFSKEHVDRETGEIQVLEHDGTPTMQTAAAMEAVAELDRGDPMSQTLMEAVETVPVDATQEAQGASQGGEGDSGSKDTGEAASASDAPPEQPDEPTVPPVEAQYLDALGKCSTAAEVQAANKEWAPRIEAAGSAVKTACQKARAARLEEIAKAGASK